MSHVYFGEIASTARLAEVREEISRLKGLPRGQRTPIALSYLKEEERVLSTEIRDHAMGMRWVTFRWGAGRATIDSKFVRVPAREVRRLKLTDSIADMVSMSLDTKYYYIHLNDTREIYNPREAEGRRICRLEEILLEGVAPHTMMVSLYDLRHGRVKLVRGERVTLKY